MDSGMPLQELCARSETTYPFPLARYSKQDNERNNCFSVAVKNALRVSPLDFEQELLGNTSDSIKMISRLSLYQDTFIEEIEGLPQTPLLEFHVELSDYSPLIQKHYVVGPVLEEIMKRLIQQYVDAGFYIRGTSQCVSPAFVVVKPNKSDDTKLEKLREYVIRN